MTINGKIIHHLKTTNIMETTTIQKPSLYERLGGEEGNKKIFR
jgi:hypothetical protein